MPRRSLAESENPRYRPRPRECHRREGLRDLGRTDRRIRCIRRFGRRGLSSACIEGILSTSARYIAVIDGDLQHDETLLPRMLDILKRERTDLVVASRYLASGAADGLPIRRHVLSRAEIWLARVLLKSEITDPVSGFFMIRPRLACPAWHQDSYRSFGFSAGTVIGNRAAVSVSRAKFREQQTRWVRRTRIPGIAHREGQRR